MLHVALAVDRIGMINAVSLDASRGTGWQGPEPLGNSCYVPGSAVTLFSPATSMYIALTVDLNGVLNAFSLDTSGAKGWLGPDSIGNIALVPGSQVTVIQQASSVFAALMVDRYGVLNVAYLDVSAPGGWQGPETIGSGNLVPGCTVSVCQQSASLFTALMVDREGVLNAATLDTSNTMGWQGPDTFGNARFLPGAPVAVG